jgi:hypothetical protein
MMLKKMIDRFYHPLCFVTVGGMSAIWQFDELGLGRSARDSSNLFERTVLIIEALNGQ